MIGMKLKLNLYVWVDPINDQCPRVSKLRGEQVSEKKQSKGNTRTALVLFFPKIGKSKGKWMQIDVKMQLENTSEIQTKCRMRN